MKYITIIGFNLLAIYILGTFVFSPGGILDNIEKMNSTYALREEKYRLQIDVLEMQNQIRALEAMKQYSPRILVKSGKKTENMVIFKFVEKKVVQKKKVKPDNKADIFIQYRIYIFLAFLLVFIVAGNILLLVKMEKKDENIHDRVSGDGQDHTIQASS